MGATVFEPLGRVVERQRARIKVLEESMRLLVSAGDNARERLAYERRTGEKKHETERGPWPEERELRAEIQKARRLI